MKGRRAASWAVTLCLGAGSAQAAEHFIEIEQVHSSADQSVQFVKLRMEFLFQNAVGIGNYMSVQDADGNVVGTFGVFDENVANHGPLVPILIGTDTVEAAFGVAPDLVVDPETDVSLAFPSGRVCWVTPNASECGPAGECDCVAYGDYAGDNSVFGDPTLSLAEGRALQKITFGTNFLWAANGTEIPGLMDNARDYVRTAPIPMNNALDFALPEDPTELVPD